MQGRLISDESLIRLKGAGQGAKGKTWYRGLWTPLITANVKRFSAVEGLSFEAVEPRNQGEEDPLPLGAGKPSSRSTCDAASEPRAAAFLVQ